MENPAVLFLIIAVTVFATARGLLRWFTTRWRRAVEMAAEPFQLTVVDHMGEPNAAGWVGICATSWATCWPVRKTKDCAGPAAA